MPSFQTVIILDLETTGLPMGPAYRPKITELAMLACEVQHCQRSIPRVVHKFVVCLNPLKVIHPISSDISGLSNDLLENIAGFNAELVVAITSFIERLPQPICLVAHNGNKFDFPILQRELVTHNLNFPNHLYCADSLLAFRALFPKPVLVKNRRSSATVAKELTNREDDELCMTAMEKYESSSPESTPVKNTARMQQINETTPPKSKIHKQLFLAEQQNGENAILNIQEKIQLLHPQSYKLGDIYKFLHGHDFQAHQAEHDCLALLSSIVKSKGFFDWIDSNAVLFNTVKPIF